MKTFKVYNSILWIIFLAFIFSSNTLSADEEVLIDTDEKAKEILLGHDWKCKWKDDTHTGTSDRVYEEASLNKVTAKVKNSFCPADWGKLEGKIEGGRVTGKFTESPEPCVPRSFKGKIFKSADGGYYTKDTYMNLHFGTTGQFECISVVK